MKRKRVYPELNDDQVYEKAVKYAKRKGFDDIKARDFAGWEWEKFHEKYTGKLRNAALWSAFIHFTRETLGDSRDKPVYESQRPSSKRLERMLTDIGIDEKNELKNFVYFEDSPIYKLARIEEILKGLSAYERAIAVLSCIFDFHPREIAFILGVPEQSVRTSTCYIPRDGKGYINLSGGGERRS